MYTIFTWPSRRKVKQWCSAADYPERFTHKWLPTSGKIFLDINRLFFWFCLGSKSEHSRDCTKPRRLHFDVKATIFGATKRLRNASPLPFFGLKQDKLTWKLSQRSNFAGKHFLPAPHFLLQCHDNPKVICSTQTSSAMPGRCRIEIEGSTQLVLRKVNCEVSSE